MKKIIALQGDAGTGKTSTITILYNLLKNANYSDVKPRARKSHDFFAIVKKGGKTVGISTYGDNTQKIRGSIQCFTLPQYSCDIIVCACHNTGATVRALNTPGYSIDFVPKTVSPNANDPVQTLIDNTKDAHTLMSKI